MNRAYVVWIDVNGFTRLTFISTTTGASTIFASMLHQSNADWVNFNETGFTTNPTPAPVAAQYQNVSETASLMFTTVSGDKCVLQLPAPKASIFLADQMTVDATAIATLLANCIGTLTNNSGSITNAFIGGIRRPTVKELYQ